MISVIRRWLAACADVNVAIAAFSIAMIAALWAVVIVDKRAEREGTIAAAIRQNTNLAVAYEEHVVRTLKGLDGALLFMRQEYRRLNRGLDINRYLGEGIIDSRQFVILSVLDERGSMVLSSRPGGPVNYADREFFRIHQQLHDQDIFYVSAPVLGRVSNTWQVPLSRRIIKADGSFGGVIVLTVDPTYLAHFYQKAAIGEHGLVKLIGTDGIVRARRAGKTLSFGADLSGTTLMREQANNATGEILVRDGVDDIPRYVSYRTPALTGTVRCYLSFLS